MAESKQIKFQFVVDQGSAREVTRVLDEMIKKAQELGKALQGGGGLLGGVRAGTGTPSPQSTLAGKGGAGSQQTSISKSVLENANAFKTFGTAGSQAMKGLTESLRSGIKDQISQIRSLEERLKAASGLYENLKKSANVPAGAAAAAQRTVMSTASAAEEAREGLREMMEMRANRPGMRGPHGGLLPDVPAPGIEHPGKWGGGAGQAVIDDMEGGGGKGGWASRAMGKMGGAGKVIGALALASGVKEAVTGVADALAGNYTVKAKNDAAKADLIAGMTDRIIGGDFTDLAVLGKQRKDQGVDATGPNSRNIDEIYNRSRFVKGAAWTHGTTNAAMGAVTAPLSAFGIGSGLGGFTKEMLEMNNGGPMAQTMQDMQQAIEQAKRANPFFTRVMRDVQSKAGQRAQAYSLLGSGGVMGGTAAREEYADLAATGAKAGGLKEEETLALRSQLADRVGATMGNQMLGRAAAAERKHGVGQATAVGALGSMALTTGSASQASAYWEEIMSKAFSTGFKDSKVKEALVQASTENLATTRGRISDPGAIFDLLAGNAKGGGMYEANMAQAGLEHANQFWGSKGTGTLKTIDLMSSSLATSNLEKFLPKGTDVEAVKLALAHQSLSEAAGGGSEQLQDLLGGGQQAKNIATELNRQRMSATMGAIAPQALSKQLTQKLKDVGGDVSKLSPTDQAAYNTFISSTSGLAGDYAAVKASTSMTNAMIQGGGLPVSTLAGGTKEDTREKDSTERGVMMTQAATSLDSLFRSFDKDTIAGIEAGTKASLVLMENLREFGEDKALSDSSAVIGAAATALRDVAAAAKDVVDVANGLPAQYRSPVAQGSYNVGEPPSGGTPSGAPGGKPAWGGGNLAGGDE